MLNISTIYQVIALVEDVLVDIADAPRNIYLWTSRKQPKWATTNVTILSIVNPTNFPKWNKIWLKIYHLNLTCLCILLQHSRMISNLPKWKAAVNKITIKISPLFTILDSLVWVLTRMNSLIGVLILLLYSSLFLLRQLSKNYLSMEILVTRILIVLLRTILLKLITKTFNSKREHKLNHISHF